MEKFEYYIKELHPSDFFDAEVDVLKILKKAFTDTKIRAKADKILIEGESSKILNICVILDSIIYFLKNNDELSESSVNEIIKGNGDKLLKPENGRVILYGTNKKKIKAHTLNQIKILEAFEKNDMVFAIGPAGCTDEIACNYDATSTTDGSLQTDGGLSVAKAIYNGTAATLAADSGVVTMGSTTAATETADEVEVVISGTAGAGGVVALKFFGIASDSPTA